MGDRPSIYSQPAIHYQRRRLVVPKVKYKVNRTGLSVMRTSSGAVTSPPLKGKEMYELVYAGRDVEKIIKEKYPQSLLVDASDYIHTERFELELEGIEEDEFYPFAISEGFARCCLGFSIRLESLRFPEIKGGHSHRETLELIKTWCEAAKSEKSAGIGDEQGRVHKRVQGTSALYAVDNILENKLL